MDSSKLKYFCIFGGGAIRGVAYAGAIKALREKDVVITGYAGSSAGSIAALIAALDYSNEEISEIFMQFDHMLFRDINFSFKPELAVSKGEIFTDKIREIIANKLNTDKTVTFKDFPKDFYVLTSNLSTGESVIFSKETTPDFEVAQAVRISAGFPGLMTPFELNGEYYVDGDLAKPYALSQISPLLNPNKSRVLEFRLEGSKKQEASQNPLEYINNAVDFLTNASTENVIKIYSECDKYDFIVLNVEKTLLFNLSLSKEERKDIMDFGYKKTIEFFNKTLTNKKKKLLTHYEKMYDLTNLAYKLLLKERYLNLKEELQKYICQNYKIFPLLNSDIIDQLSNLTNETEKNLSKKLFFKTKLNNYNEINNKIKTLNVNLHKTISNFNNYIKANNC